jgi:hypothetical protein
MQRGAFHAGHELHQAGIADIQNEAVNDLVAEVAMGHLAALEAQGGLDLVAFSQETDGLILLGLIVVLVDGHGELDLFDDDDLLFLAGGAIALVFLVEELSVVLNLADRGNGVGGDLYQVERALAGHLEGVEGSHDAELFAIFVDDANLAGADAFVGADKRLGGTFINRWNKSPPQRIFSAAMRCLGFRCKSHKRLHRNVKYNTLRTKPPVISEEDRALQTSVRSSVVWSTSTSDPFPLAS